MGSSGHNYHMMNLNRELTDVTPLLPKDQLYILTSGRELKLVFIPGYLKDLKEDKSI